MCFTANAYAMQSHVDRWAELAYGQDLSLVCAWCRDSELAKFEAFLSKLGGSNTRAMVRGRQRLAYPISKCGSQILHSVWHTVCLLV